MFIFVKYG